MGDGGSLEEGLRILQVVQAADRPVTSDELTHLCSISRSAVDGALPLLVASGFVFAQGLPPKYEPGFAFAEKTDPVPSLPPELAEFIATTPPFDPASELPPLDLIGLPEMQPPQEPKPHFGDAGIDGSFLALLSIIGRMPLVDVADLLIDEQIPAVFVDALAGTSLQDLGPLDAEERLRDVDPVVAFMDVFDEIPQSQWDIIYERLTIAPKSFEAIGLQLDLTRSRVKQIYDGIRASFEARFSSNVLIAERAALAREAIGGIVDSSRIWETVVRVLPLAEDLHPTDVQAILFLLFPEGHFTTLDKDSSWLVSEAGRRRLADVCERAVAGVAMEEFVDEFPELRFAEQVNTLLVSLGLMEVDGMILGQNRS